MPFRKSLVFKSKFNRALHTEVPILLHANHLLPLGTAILLAIENLALSSIRELLNSTRARAEFWASVSRGTAIYPQCLVRVAAYTNSGIHIYICIYEVEGVHLLATLPFCTVHVTVTFWACITTPVFPTCASRAEKLNILTRRAIFPASTTAGVAVQPQHQRHVGEGSCNDQSGW